MSHLLEVDGLTTAFDSDFGRTVSVDHVNFTVDKGEVVCIVGESGCGKSTSGRSIVGLTKPDGGSILYHGQDLCKLSEKEFRPLRKELQMVFQNTLSALNLSLIHI